MKLKTRILAVISILMMAVAFLPTRTVSADWSGQFTLSSATYTVNEYGGSVSVTIRLSGSRTGWKPWNATVNYATSNGTATAGSDYTAVSGSRYFKKAGSYTFTIPITNDVLQEGNETFNITLTCGSSCNGATIGTPGSAVITIVDDDTAGITVSPTSGLTTTEAGGTATFSMVLRKQPAADVTIALSSSDTSEGTVSPASVTFTSSNWTLARTITVTGVNDAVDDGNIAYTILTAPAVSGDPLYSGMNASDVSVTNLDNDTAGITVNPVSGLSVTETGGTTTFTVVLTSQPLADVSLDLTSLNTDEGTVAPASLTFTAANWNTPQTVTVTGVDDAVEDGNVHFSILTAPASSTDPAYDGMDAADVDVINIDNDSAGITIIPTSGLVTSEAGGTATFMVVLNTQPIGEVTLALASSDTSEGTVSPLSLVFTDSDWNIPQTVTVTGVDDPNVDGDITYSIITSAAVSTDGNYNNLDPENVTVINQDNDIAGIEVTPIDNLIVNEGGSTATFTVVLETPPLADVTIGLTSDDTSEGTVSPASLTFTSSNWSTARTVTVTGVNDAIVDGDVTFHIVTSPAVSSDPAYNGLDASDVTVLNIDNDYADVTILPLGGLVTNETGGTDTFQVVLDTLPTNNVTISFDSSDTSEGTVSPSILTFTTLNWSTPQTVTITGVDDLVVDGNVGYLVSGTTNSRDANYDALDLPDIEVTNLDNDAAGIAVTPTSGLGTTEIGGTATFTVALTSQPVSDVIVPLSSSNPQEGTISPTSLTFTAGDWNSAQTVTITGVDDSIADGNVAFSILIGPAESLDPVYIGLNASNVSVTNTDDDTAGITVDPTSGLITTEAGGTATFTVVLTSEPTADVTIDLTSSNTNEGTVSPSSLVFTASDWSDAQTVTVTGVDDADLDGDILYTIQTSDASSTDPVYDHFSVSDVTVTNTDDESPETPNVVPVAVADEYSTTFHVQLIVNPAGVLSNDGEDPEGDPLTAVLVEDLGAGQGTLVLNPDGSFTFTPADNFIGDASFRYAISDGKGTSSPVIVTIHVTGYRVFAPTLLKP